LNKQQWIVAGSGALILFSLYFFGRTKPLHKDKPAIAAQDTQSAPEGQFSIDTLLAKTKAELPPAASAYITGLEKSISRGDLKTQKIKLYGDLATYWKDSARHFVPYLYYTGEKAKLENSEKNLNFAAHSYLEELRGVADPSLKSWMAEQANALYSQSLSINPNNDSTKVGWGSTYFFGAGKGASPMEGIMKIREVAMKDSTNLFAQFMLGYGGLASGQLDKAAERFKKVVKAEPDNKEAIFLLAETYERMGDKAQARKWYETGKKGIDNPEALKAIDEKIKTLQ
jgi:tetratricopeptide (TPR) repeat protein